MVAPEMETQTPTRSTIEQLIFFVVQTLVIIDAVFGKFSLSNIPLKYSTFKWFKTLACTTVLVDQQTMSLVGSTILIAVYLPVACMQKTKIADSLLPGTLSGLRDFETVSRQIRH